MTRRSLFKTAAAAFAGSVLAKLPLAGAIPAEFLRMSSPFQQFQRLIRQECEEIARNLLAFEPNDPFYRALALDSPKTKTTFLGPVEIVLGEKTT